MNATLRLLICLVLGGLLGVALAWIADGGTRGAIVLALLALAFVLLALPTDRENRP